MLKIQEQKKECIVVISLLLFLYAKVVVVGFSTSWCAALFFHFFLVLCHFIIQNNNNQLLSFSPPFNSIRNRIFVFRFQHCIVIQSWTLKAETKHVKIFNRQLANQFKATL